jgi:hypothetical protein
MLRVQACQPPVKYKPVYTQILSINHIPDLSGEQVRDGSKGLQLTGNLDHVLGAQ